MLPKNALTAMLANVDAGSKVIKNSNVCMTIAQNKCNPPIGDAMFKISIREGSFLRFLRDLDNVIPTIILLQKEGRTENEGADGHGRAQHAWRPNRQPPSKPDGVMCDHAN